MYSLMASEAAAVIQKLLVRVLPSPLWYSIVLNKAINNGLRGQTASDRGRENFFFILRHSLMRLQSFINFDAAV